MGPLGARSSKMQDQYTLDDREDQVVLRTAWEQAVGKLECELPETVIKKFLRPLEPVSLEGGVAVLNAPGQFIQEWVKEKYLETILVALSSEIEGVKRIELRVQPRERPETQVETAVISRQPLSIDPTPEFKSTGRYRFENFVVGQSNRLAFAGAKAVAAQPGVKYNPLFLYGSSGLGKTHLMQAIAHEIHRRDNRCAVMYVTAQQFAEEFVHALQNNRIDQFRKAQRGVQVWLLDDVQFIAGKERTQEELFHTFNYLHSLGKQIVLCSDRPPRDLLLMDERLRSRFESGLVADVLMPDTETRCAILLTKAQQDDIELSHDVAMFVAEAIPSNVRILEGALTKIAAEASLEEGAVTLELARSIVERYYQNVGTTKPSFEQILDSVGKHYQIPVIEIRGISRKAPIAHARHVAVFITREITGDSWKHIGALFGNRDHTSMMHGYRKIRELMNRDKEVNASVKLLIRDLYPEV
ncbi:MAG: chromosomal replication initiator protein DnaA [Armatimonadetes bacterium]|nr:chromosomal replication initiator protein DnaA [Armatimonadota bacterium]